MLDGAFHCGEITHFQHQLLFLRHGTEREEYLPLLINISISINGQSSFSLLFTGMCCLRLQHPPLHILGSYVIPVVTAAPPWLHKEDTR